MNRKANVSKELNEKHRKILESLLKLPENRECAECKSKGPRWASVNLGIFICMQCSGIHRSLGVHISKVRSATLDTWLPEQIAIVQSMGNEKSNSYWEGELPPNYNRVGIENFIHAKYVQKKWVSRNGIGKSPSRASGEKASIQQATISSVPKQVNVLNHAPQERKIIHLPTTNGNNSATSKSGPPPTPVVVPQQVTPEVKPTKPILGSEPAPTKGELKKKQETANPVVPAKVDYATELFNLLCMDDSRGSDSNPSANDDGWVHFQSSEAPSTAGRNDSPAMVGPSLANPNNNMINAFEKSIIASPFSTHQQVAVVTPQQSFPMTSAAKPSGVYQAFPANTHRLGSNGAHMATQSSVSGGYLAPGMTMPISEPQRYIQAGSSQQGYTVNRPMSSMYNNRAGTMAPSINGMINMKAAVPPPAFPVASSSPQPSGYYDLSFLTQGMLSKR